MKNIEYTFADGHKEIIEVEDSVAEVYEEYERYERNRERAETRRHVSLNVLMDDGFDFSNPEEDIDVILEKREKTRNENEVRKYAEKELKYQRKKLETKLTPRQAEAYFRFEYLHLKKVTIAEIMGITEGAVRKLILKAEENLEKLRKQALEVKKEKERQKRKETLKRKKEKERMLDLRLIQAIFGQR